MCHFSLSNLRFFWKFFRRRFSSLNIYYKSADHIFRLVIALTNWSVFESWSLFTDLSNRLTTFRRVRNKWRLNFVSRRGKNLRITPWTYSATCQFCLLLKRPTSALSRHDIAFVKPGCHIKELQKMPKKQKISSFTLYNSRYSFLS